MTIKISWRNDEHDIYDCEPDFGNKSDPENYFISLYLNNTNCDYDDYVSDPDSEGEPHEGMSNECLLHAS